MADVRSKLGAPILDDFNSSSGTPIVCNQTTGEISVLKIDNTIQEMALVGGSASQDFAAANLTATNMGFNAPTGSGSYLNYRENGVNQWSLQRDAISGGNTFYVYNNVTATIALSFNATTNDVYTTAWADYGATSTIVGFSSIIVKSIFTKKIGKLCFVKFFITGTSNATGFTFTLPFTSGVDCALNLVSGYLADNGGVLNSPGLINLENSSSTVNLFKTMSSGVWTASGTKQMYGEFFYETA